MSQTYRDNLIFHAAQKALSRAAQLAPGEKHFINLHRQGTALTVELTSTLIDDAAEDAARDGGYAGTVMITEHGQPVMLDLREHGAGILNERKTEEVAEAAHERSLAAGAGRIVL